MAIVCWRPEAMFINPFSHCLAFHSVFFPLFLPFFLPVKVRYSVFLSFALFWLFQVDFFFLSFLVEEINRFMGIGLSDKIRHRNENKRKQLGRKPNVRSLGLWNPVINRAVNNSWINKCCQSVSALTGFISTRFYRFSIDWPSITL